VHGDDCQKQIDQIKKYSGVSKIIVSKDASLQNAYGDSVAKVVSSLVKSKGYDKIVAASSSFGKDVVPRVGGILDL